MEKIVSNLMRLVAGREETKARDMPINRIAMRDSQDRSLAAFKAEQARIAGRQDRAAFTTKRAVTR